MKKIQLFEQAMCCPTGLCGVGVDPALLRISTAFNTLKKNGIAVERYNLASAPQEFIINYEVNKLLMKDGVEILPITLVDGVVVKTKGYPTNNELLTFLDIPKSYLGEEEKPSKTFSIKQLPANGKITTKKQGSCGKGGCC